MCCLFLSLSVEKCMNIQICKTLHHNGNESWNGGSGLFCWYVALDTMFHMTSVTAHVGWKVNISNRNRHVMVNTHKYKKTKHSPKHRAALLYNTYIGSCLWPKGCNNYGFLIKLSISQWVLKQEAVTSDRSMCVYTTPHAETRSATCKSISTAHSCVSMVTGWLPDPSCIALRFLSNLSSAPTFHNDDTFLLMH